MKNKVLILLKYVKYIIKQWPYSGFFKKEVAGDLITERLFIK